MTDKEYGGELDPSMSNTFPSNPLSDFAGCRSFDHLHGKSVSAWRVGARRNILGSDHFENILNPLAMVVVLGMYRN